MESCSCCRCFFFEQKYLLSFFLAPGIRYYDLFAISSIFRISDILACSFLDELLELRDQDLAKDLQEANWFSAPSALRVYGNYNIYYHQRRIFSYQLIMYLLGLFKFISNIC